MTADYVGTPTPINVASARIFETAADVAGYLLSPKAVSIIATSQPTHPAEDVQVARVLHAAAINLTKSSRFHAGKQTTPEAGNQQVTAHHITPAQMLVIHAGF